MLYSLGLVLLFGFIAGWLFQKIHLPDLVGMILVGVLLGSTVLNWLSPDLLNISSQLRQIALVIILTRSGLNLDLASLKKVGRPAILLCFVPASFEIVGVGLSAHFLLNLSWVESFLLGSVLAAVSPAVVSPRMISLAGQRYGEKHAVPKMVLAGASADDVFVIVLFYTFLGLAQNQSFSFTLFATVPLSIVLGILLGIAVGLAEGFLFKKVPLPLPVQILITLSLSFLMIGLEEWVKEYVSISSLLGVTVAGMSLLFTNEKAAKELSSGYNGLWKVFEIILFVLVGASVNFSYAVSEGAMPFAVLFIGLAVRSVGVLLCLIATPLTRNERIFTVISYLPKATVQASIGGIALSVGLGCGEMVLTVAVISILVTAPLGALLIDGLAKKLLKQE